MRRLFMIGLASVMMMHTAEASTWFWQNESDVCGKAPFTPQGFINYSKEYNQVTTKVTRNPDNSIAEVDVYVMDYRTDDTTTTTFFKTMADCEAAGGTENNNDLK